MPLGRAGATKRQHLKLGQGTSQHVLIAGKTGSGKSTLLHALITNLALCYSPDEVELYLIDFKKGVEFKIYAALRAAARPRDRHRERARVRPERAPAAGRRAEGCAASASASSACRTWRATARRPDVPMPRILLIVDEFQEFFVEDDKIAQEVALLLDRLVRQGRAFGMHVILGSQTLGGAYSLARSTLDQMAVRIALQCSEADAHLILSEDNTAARLLTRPGEAIYNDANGLIEGNNLFQVVWLSDERRETTWSRSATSGKERKGSLTRPPIVFEGNAAGRPGANPLLTPAARPAGLARLRAFGPGLARRRDRDQGPDGRRLPPPERQQPADRRPERRGGAGRHGRGHRQPRRPVPSRRPRKVAARARFFVLDGSPRSIARAGSAGPGRRGPAPRDQGRRLARRGAVPGRRSRRAGAAPAGRCRRCPGALPVRLRPAAVPRPSPVARTTSASAPRRG